MPGIGEKVPVNTLNSCAISFACGCSFSVTNGNVKPALCGPSSKNHMRQDASIQLSAQIVNKLHEFQVVSGN